MPINVYDKGDLVRLSVVFKDLAGAPADPSTVTFSMIDPDGVALTPLTLPPGPEIVKDSVGNYHTDFDVTKAGVFGEYHYEWKGAGNVQSGEVGQFTAKPSKF